MSESGSPWVSLLWLAGIFWFYWLVKKNGSKVADRTNSETIRLYEKKLPGWFRLFWPLVLFVLMMAYSAHKMSDPAFNPNDDPELAYGILMYFGSAFISLLFFWFPAFMYNTFMEITQKPDRLDYNFARNFYLTWTVILLFMAVIPYIARG